MRLRDIRRRDSADLQQEVLRLREQVFQKRFHGHNEEKGDRGVIRKSRRDVARILTVLGQRERTVGEGRAESGRMQEAR